MKKSRAPVKAILDAPAAGSPPAAAGPRPAAAVCMVSIAPSRRPQTEVTLADFIVKKKQPKKSTNNRYQPLMDLADLDSMESALEPTASLEFATQARPFSNAPRGSEGSGGVVRREKGFSRDSAASA